ncbi:hypothetical protein Tco_0015933 [Tanacetum coccineum]
MTANRISSDPDRTWVKYFDLRNLWVMGLPRFCCATLISTSFTQGKVSSISIGGSKSSEGFLSSILLSVVIIVTVVFVVVVLVFIVIAIVGVVIVVVFRIIVVIVPLVPVFLLGLLALAIDSACAFRAEEMPSLISCRMATKVMVGVSDVDVLLGGILSTKDNAGYVVIHEDGDNDAISGNDDERAINWKFYSKLRQSYPFALTASFEVWWGRSINQDELDSVVEEEDGEWIRFSGGNSSSGIKKYRGLNSRDGGNIGDRVKIAGGVIGSGDEIGEGSGVNPEVPDELTLKSLNEGAGMIPEVSDEPSDYSSSLSSNSEFLVKDISSDEADATKKADEAKKANVVKDSKEQPEKPKETLISSSKTLSSTEFTSQFLNDNPKITVNDRPLLVVTTVTLILDTTTASPTQPPPTQPKGSKVNRILKKSKRPKTQVDVGELNSIVNILEKQVHVMSSFNLPEAIDKSVKAHLKNVLPKDVPDFGKIKMEKAAMKSDDIK